MLDALRDQLDALSGAGGSSSLTRLVLDQMPVGIVAAAAPSGEVVFQNARAAAILGHGAAGAAPAKAYCGAMHPDGRPYAPEDYAVTRVLADGRRIEGESCLYRRPDGSVVTLSFDADLIRGPDGGPALAVATFRDMSAEREADRARESLERRLAGVLEATTDCVIVLDRDWRIAFLNGRARALVADGRELIGEAMWDAFPEAVGGELWRAWRECMETGRATVARERLSECGATFEAHASPFEDGIAVFCRDVTAEQAAEAARLQLTRELAHRVGNLFTLVAGMVKMTARSAASPQEMADKLAGRIVALSRAHDLVRPAVAGDTTPTPTTLAALVDAVLAPHREGAAEVTADCADVAVGPDAATSLALVLHELATNAAKYGALAGSGSLAVWVERPAPERLAIVWRERLGEPVTPPEGGGGFGSTLIRATARGRLGGEVAYDWGADGLTVRIVCDAARLSS